MPRQDPTLFDRLQTLFNFLAGVADPPALPRPYGQRSVWEERRDTLEIPAVWRRQRRVA